MPSTNASHMVYRTVARPLLDKGVALRELLLKHRLGETLLDDLTPGLFFPEERWREFNRELRSHWGEV